MLRGNGEVADDFLEIYIALFFFFGMHLIYHSLFIFDIRLEAVLGASCLPDPFCLLALELSCLSNLSQIGFWISGKQIPAETNEEFERRTWRSFPNRRRPPRPRNGLLTRSLGLVQELYLSLGKGERG